MVLRLTFGSIVKSTLDLILEKVEIKLSAKRKRNKGRTDDPICARVNNLEI